MLMVTLVCQIVSHLRSQSCLSESSKVPEPVDNKSQPMNTYLNSMKKHKHFNSFQEPSISSSVPRIFIQNHREQHSIFSGHDPAQLSVECKTEPKEAGENPAEDCFICSQDSLSHF